MSHLDGVNFGNDQINPFAVAAPYYYLNENQISKNDSVNIVSGLERIKIKEYDLGNIDYIPRELVPKNIIVERKIPKKDENEKEKDEKDEKEKESGKKSEYFSNMNNQDLMMILLFILIVLFVLQIKIMAQLEIVNKYIMSRQNGM